MLYPSSDLPLSQITLSQWQLVKISGADTVKFLQGQLTNDINKLTNELYQFAAHCDPKGKVWGNLILFKRGEDIYYIERKSALESQLKELKKYAVFSKVTIEVCDDWQIVGVAGKATDIAQITLTGYFSEQQNCATQDDITYLKLDFPITRYLAIAPKDKLTSLTQDPQYAVSSNEQWQLLDMEANYPIVDNALCNQYLPQTFNLQNFNAISFDKGCYCGQEMVARAQYRGINKRGLFLLSGHGQSLPIIGDSIEQKLGDNWRATGTVTAALQLNENMFWVQVILNNDTESDSQFRIKEQPESTLSIAAK